MADANMLNTADMSTTDARARRAERQAVALQRSGAVSNGEIIRYLNRLSSLLFMLARAEDLQETGGVVIAKQS